MGTFVDSLGIWVAKIFLTWLDVISTNWSSKKFCINWILRSFALRYQRKWRQKMPCQRAQPSWLPPRSPSPVGAPYVRSRDFEFFSEPGSNMGWRLWWGCFGAATRANTGYLSERGSGVLVSVNISMHPFQQESRCSSHSTKSHSSLFQGLRESGLVVGPVHKGMPPTQSTQRKVCQPFNCRDDVWWEPQAVSKWVENTMTVQISNPIQIQIQIQFKFKFSSNPIQIQIQIQIQFKFKFKFSSHSYSNPIQIQIPCRYQWLSQCTQKLFNPL